MSPTRIPGKTSSEIFLTLPELPIGEVLGAGGRGGGAGRGAGTGAAVDGLGDGLDGSGRGVFLLVVGNSLALGF